MKEASLPTPAATPDFLIVGAMKSGTTSLYFDLSANPAVFMPEDKEPDALTTDTVLTEPGRSRYERLFRGKLPDQICGEASTTYTKLPDYSGAPQRAKAVCGSDLRILYIVREPIARLISHHHHDAVAGRMTDDIEAAVATEPSLVDYSRYAMQITPWIAEFGREQVLIIRFEDFIEDRHGVGRRVASFLGIEPVTDPEQALAIHNQGAGKPVPRGFVWRIATSAIYRRTLRRIVPRDIRHRWQRRLQPKAPAPTAELSAESVSRVLHDLRDDHEQLRDLMGLDELPWDFEAISSRYADSR